MAGIQGLFSKISLRLYIVIGLIVVLAILPLIGDIALQGLVTKILIFGLIAMSLDLIVGYLGLWSFCHATFVGAAAYTTAIMVRHLGITNFFITAPASFVAAGLLACLLGYISLRVSFLYFLLVTLALGQAFYYTTIIGVDIFGGSDGLYGIPYPFFANTPESFYYFALVVCLVCFYALYLITKSPFGYVLQGIRDNETRMKTLGYNVWLYKFAAFVISALFAAVAGILYVHFNGLISPVMVDIGGNGLPWLLIIIGGAATLWGALTGSLIIFTLQYFVSTIAPERWPIFLGAAFVIAVMFARRGVFVLIRQLFNRRKYEVS
jgi:branched-chain amino acid transport system permease protein